MKMFAVFFLMLLANVSGLSISTLESSVERRAFVSKSAGLVATGFLSLPNIASADIETAVMRMVRAVSNTKLLNHRLILTLHLHNVHRKSRQNIHYG